jgi:hypothetical protein
MTVSLVTSDASDNDANDIMDTNHDIRDKDISTKHTLVKNNFDKNRLKAGFGSHGLGIIMGMGPATEYLSSKDPKLPLKS